MLAKPDAPTQAQISATYGKLPLSFEANQGQTDAQVNFLSRGSGYTLFLTATEAVLSLRKSAAPSSGEARDPQVTTGTVLRMQLIGGNPEPAVAGLERLPGQVNYFIGHDPARWRRNVPLYGKVTYEGVYPGIDLVYYGNQRQLEYDFVVAPGASPNAIRLELEGAERLYIDARGDLVIHTALGEIRQRKPLIYQERGGTREAISGGYVLVSGRQVGFEVGPYDTARPLVIDPTLVYSTYLGGGGFDLGFGIAVDAAGNAYVTGFTNSANFPTTPGAFDTALNGGDDAFVAKIGEAVGPPATLTLSPPTATNPVDAQHCVTATVEDAAGNPVPDVTVQFMVTGAVTTSGSETTDENGEAVFCYPGPALPGADVITAFADTDDDGTPDLDEPSGAATKTWVLPVTTPLCEITITQGGLITANNGDKATFGGNAQSSASGATKGQEQYQDHGPVQPLNVHSINVLAIVCEGSTRASIYGQATINGSGSFFYRINVQDLAEPGVGRDTYGILLTGYDSGEKILEGGNVQIRRR